MKLNRDSELLKVWGWNSHFQDQIDESKSESEIARVISTNKDIFQVQISETESVHARVSGNFRKESEISGLWPSVGDWVLLRNQKMDGEPIIDLILERKTCMARKVAGQRFDRQILSANFDSAFIATSVNEDLNMRRLERYLSLVWESGGLPVILLTKIDLQAKFESIVAEIKEAFPGVDVKGISLERPETIELLKPHLSEGKTSVIVGSSGVGKSSLVNALVGKDILLTRQIREEDGRGRHTSTSRQLLKTLYGGLMIDTPGMREIQLMDHEEGVEKNFEDIQALIARCRFSDCQHRTEPNCEIMKSLESGVLQQDRWKSYLKLLREMAHFKRKQDKSKTKKS